MTQGDLNTTSGERLRAWRQAAELTQTGLADLTGVSQSTIARLEGDELAMSLDMASNLAGELRCRWIDLVAGKYVHALGERVEMPVASEIKAKTLGDMLQAIEADYNGMRDRGVDRDRFNQATIALGYWFTWETRSPPFRPLKRKRRGHDDRRAIDRRLRAVDQGAERA